ncbi:hypothetical protein [Sessilibacter sp. MAH2]
MNKQSTISNKPTPAEIQITLIDSGKVLALSRHTGLSWHIENKSTNLGCKLPATSIVQ